ncbi:MAG TPA: hypothetical protein VK148_11500, partial [Xanthobacteraceae bacterium]|nr:hypothetical protein [Xanthobacteraceae bacterium]
NTIQIPDPIFPSQDRRLSSDHTFSANIQQFFSNFKRSPVRKYGCRTNCDAEQYQNSHSGPQKKEQAFRSLYEK